MPVAPVTNIRYEHTLYFSCQTSSSSSSVSPSLPRTTRSPLFGLLEIFGAVWWVVFITNKLHHIRNIKPLGKKLLGQNVS